MDYHGSLKDCHNVTLFVEENLNLHEFRFRSDCLVPKEDKQHFFYNYHFHISLWRFSFNLC